MSEQSFSLGIDFGSNSVRALFIDAGTGEEFGVGVVEYSAGDKGVLSDSANPHVARQRPSDYLSSMEKAVALAMDDARSQKGFDSGKVVGIGVDTTGSTPIPVDASNRPLEHSPEFKDNLDALAWMWKDHSGMEEAEKITAAARETRPAYLAKCGGTYSSEWFFSKIWHCLNASPEVFDAAASWVEFADFIPAVLAGVDDPKSIKRSVCAAGHKAMFSSDWGGLPDEEFLASLDPRLPRCLDGLYDTACAADEVAGRLCPEWASKFGLPSNVPVAVGAFDAHMGAVGAGVGPGRLVKIIGTSTCDLMVAPNSMDLPDIPGVCGVVDGSVLPGYYGIEAGQSAVGDIFNWFVAKVCKGGGAEFAELTAEAEKLSPGESGLVALDWNNGNRTVLVDPKLTGLIMGLTLHTSRAEIFRALIEATAFGARKIIDRLEEFGVRVEDVVNCGGIAEKNTMLMDIYASVLNRPMRISASSQTCALGAAMFGAVVGGAHADIESAQKRICAFKERIHRPDPSAVALYDELYGVYSELHDGFGVGKEPSDCSGAMKKLLSISSEARLAKADA